MLIAMNEDQQALSEVVVVGYGKKKKSNVAGATAKINLKAKEKYKTPQPVIGKRKYKKYLEENLIRPNDESCKDVKGEVVLSFFVDKEGKPQNITVVHGLCESVTVPIFVPVYATLAPMIGSPFSSVTLPFIRFKLGVAALAAFN